MPRITKRLVDALLPELGRDSFTWDTELKGFGVRMKPSGAASYILQYRTQGGATRRMVIGRMRTLTPDEARTRARRLLLTIADGEDPSVERRAERNRITVADLCDQYLEAARNGQVITGSGKPKKPSTVKIDEGRVTRHIKPLLGAVQASRLTRGMVQAMVDAIAVGRTAKPHDKKRGGAQVRGGAPCAASCCGLLGGIWTWAELRELVRGDNPAHGVRTVGDVALDRVLTEDELARLGHAMTLFRPRSTNAPDALRLIALTGLRLTEASGLRWSEVDVEGRRLTLLDTKTGPSQRPLGSAAIALLASRERTEELVFPSPRTGEAFIPSPSFRAIFALAEVAATPRDLRRTYASAAAELGYADSTIGAMLGHARTGVTSKHYIRKMDPVLADAADATSTRVAAALDRVQAQIAITLNQK